jgi:hypothetical protein
MIIKAVDKTKDIEDFVRRAASLTVTSLKSKLPAAHSLQSKGPRATQRFL